MSKKISEMPPKASMVDADEFTILDSADANLETKNKRVLRSAALANKQDLVPAGGATYLGKDPNWTPAGDSATRNVGTAGTDVAAGNAPASAVSGHESSFNHANLPTAAQKAGLDNAPTAPSAVNPYMTQNDVPAATTLHANLTDLATSGHPGGVINIPAGVEGNAVSIAADGTLQDAGIPPGGGGGGGTQKGTPFVTGDMLAVQSSSGDGIIQSVGFAASDVARLSVGNTFASAKQIFQSAAAVGFDIYQSGTTGQKGRWVTQSSSGLLVLRSTNDSGSQVETNPELRIGHGNNADKGMVLGGATFQGYATLNAENGLYDAGNRAYSAGNPPPPSAPASHAASHNDGGADALAAFGAATQGVVPASGGGTTNFLRADGNWAAPVGGGGWQDGSTITDWGDTEQTLGSLGAGTSAVDLDNGHLITATLTGDRVFNFSSTANHSQTSWDAIIATGGNTPTFQFGGVAIGLPDGYDVSADATYWFTFRRTSAGTFVSERKMQ